MSGAVGGNTSKVSTCLWFGRDPAVHGRVFAAMQGMVKLNARALEDAAGV